MMNSLKAQLTQKIDHLKEGRALIYHHAEGDSNRSYLITSAENLHDETLENVINHCCNLSLLVSDVFLEKCGHHLFSTQSEVALKCDFSVDGLKSLISSLSASEVQSGPDCMLMRVKDSASILHDETAEARILEFMSNIDAADGVLLYGLLLDEHGEHLEKAAGPQKMDLLSISTDEIKLSRFFNPMLLEFTGVTEVELQQGKFLLHSYYSALDRRYHWAFVQDDGEVDKLPLVRLESECLTGHVFGSLLCDCGDQLSQGLEQVNAYGKGALVYLRQEGRGIGLKAKLEAYYLQQVHNLDTVDANIAVGMPEDARDYVIGAQILNHLGFDSLKLMTNNPAKIKGLNRYGIKIDERVSHIIPPSNLNRKYLETKKTRMGHRI